VVAHEEHNQCHMTFVSGKSHYSQESRESRPNVREAVAHCRCVLQLFVSAFVLLLSHQNQSRDSHHSQSKTIYSAQSAGAVSARSPASRVGGEVETPAQTTEGWETGWVVRDARGCLMQLDEVVV